MGEAPESHQAYNHIQTGSCVVHFVGYFTEITQLPFGNKLLLEIAKLVSLQTFSSLDSNASPLERSM